MRHYTTRDGLMVHGTTSAEVIDDLRAHSMTPGRTLREYMLATAERATAQTGAAVDGETCDALLQGLVTAGLLTPVGGLDE